MGLYDFFLSCPVPTQGPILDPHPREEGLSQFKGTQGQSTRDGLVSGLRPAPAASIATSPDPGALESIQKLDHTQSLGFLSSAAR